MLRRKTLFFMSAWYFIVGDVMHFILYMTSVAESTEWKRNIFAISAKKLGYFWNEFLGFRDDEWTKAQNIGQWKWLFKTFEEIIDFISSNLIKFSLFYEILKVSGTHNYELFRSTKKSTKPLNPQNSLQDRQKN